MGERIVDSRKMVVEKAMIVIVRKQLKELYEEKNRRDGWGRGKSKEESTTSFAKSDLF